MERMAEHDIPSLDKERLVLPEEATWDQSSRAEAVLDHILQTTVAEEEGAPAINRITVKEAIAARPVLDIDTGRTKARVLFVTTDERALAAGSGLRNDYVKLASEFDELHVFCLVPRSGPAGFDRVGQNAWFYQVRAKSWWTLPWAARSAADEALTWNGVFRPDVVVGVDLFEAGLAARLIARRFDRPLQYHVFTDPFAPEYKRAAPDNAWRVRLAKFLLRRARSIRAKSAAIKEALQRQRRGLRDIAVLPRFYNFSGIMGAAPTLDLHAKYPDFAFIMLAFGPLTADSRLHDLFAALNRLLRNPRIGLVVVGDGPGKRLFLDKVKILGLEKSVAFQKEPEDLVSYLKTADLLVELDTSEDGEVRILQAAAAGLPIVALETDLRLDLFKDGQSAFLCPPGDLLCVSQKVSKFMNTASYRTLFSQNAADIAKNRIYEDPTMYDQALALSIESVLVPGEEGA